MHLSNIVERPVTDVNSKSATCQLTESARLFSFPIQSRSIKHSRTNLGHLVMDATWPTFLFYLFLSTLCRAWAFSSKVFISYVFVAKKENTKNQPKYEITAILKRPLTAKVINTCQRRFGSRSSSETAEAWQVAIFRHPFS